MAKPPLLQKPSSSLLARSIAKRVENRVAWWWGWASIITTLSPSLLIARAFCSRFLILLLAQTLVLALVGCASVSVKDVQKGGVPGHVPKPQIIYVADFETNSGIWNVDRSGAQLIEFKADLNKLLCSALIVRLSKNIAPAVHLRPNESFPVPCNGWLLTGKFLTVKQGSRALRMVFGFGAGGTKLETRVTIRDLSQPGMPIILSSKTTGGSNAEPGAIMNIDLVGAGVSLVMNSARGLTEDAVRTSRMIVALSSEYGAEHGWIDPSRALKPKTIAP